MGYKITAVLSIIATFVLINLLFKTKYGSNYRRSSFLEALIVAVIFGVTLGTMCYLNPAPALSGVWNPAIPILDKLLYWVLTILWGGTGTRIVLEIVSGGFVNPILFLCRQLLIVLFGLLFAAPVFLIYCVLFDWRTLGIHPFPL
jgi:hypothetical protein